MRVPSVFVIVPAHDEERVVQRGVGALLASPDVDVHVLVVANGCTDATGDRVRALADARVRVLELERPGKAGAVRAGLAAAPAVDVLAVMDADVVLSEEVLAGLASVLAVPEARIAAPGLHLMLDGCSRSVRAYYRAWRGEPHARPDDIGARGLYAVNPAGRERLIDLPDIIADDGWARARFARDERVVGAGTSTVRPTKDLRAQVRRRARVLAGNRQLQQVLPLSERPAPRTGVPPVLPRTFGRRLRECGVSGTLVWYGVELPSRALARSRDRRGEDSPWGRDASTRR